MDLGAVDKALYDLLTNDSELAGLLASSTSVYNDVIPADAALPAVVFSLSAAVEMQDRPSAVHATYEVKAVAESLSRASAAAARIDKLLNLQELSVAGLKNYQTIAANYIRYIEQGAQQSYGHAGGLYVIKLEE